MEQLGTHWKSFHEIWYLSIFRKFVTKNVLRLPGTLQEDISAFYGHISLHIFGIRNIGDKLCRKNRNTRYIP
jgi:hypothetical protein